MNNYLLPVINSYFKEISALEGKLFVSKYFIENFSKSLKNDLTFKHESVTVYRDLSIPKKQFNLFPTGYEYNVDRKNLEDEIVNILSREFCLTLSQAYEVFESFLIKILTEFLYHNQNHLVTLKILKTNLYLTKPTIKEKIKFQQKTNNKGLISFIRKLSSYFKQHETNNTWKEDISRWFDLLSEVRHNIVHNRQVVSDKFLRYLTKHNANELFDRYFSKKNINGEICVYQDHHQSMNNIDRLNEFAFLIFKSLSVDNGLDSTYQKIE